MLVIYLRLFDRLNTIILLCALQLAHKKCENVNILSRQHEFLGVLGVEVRPGQTAPFCRQDDTYNTQVLL